MPDFPTNAFGDGEDSVIPNFHYRQVHNEEKSEKEGHTVFEDREFVEIIIPGNSRERPIFEVTQKHKDRWPVQYARFQNNQEQQFGDGMPLAEWTQITRSMAATFEHDKVFTVEQLAEIPDVNLQSMGPGMLDLKYKAQKYLESRSDEDAYNKLVSENLEKDKKIESLESKMKELEGRLDELATESPKSNPPVAKAGKKS